MGAVKPVQRITQVSVRRTTIRIDPANRQAALEAAQRMMRGPALNIVTATGEFFFNPNDLKFDKGETNDLRAIFSEFGWEFEEDLADPGGITNIKTERLDRARTFALFEALRPFILPAGGYVEFWDEHGENWRILFAKKGMYERRGDVSWPVPEPGEENQVTVEPIVGEEQRDDQE